MTQPSLFQKLSKLLGLRVEDIRANVRPLRGKVVVAARRVRGPRGQAAAKNIEKQNELHKQWQESPDEGKPAIAKELFKEVRLHAQNMVWRRIPELGKSSLAGDIASVVIEKLGEFRGDANAKFTTWVHKIVLNKINMEFRQRENSREKFVEYDPENVEVALAASGVPGAIDLVEEMVLLERIKREVSAKEYALLECMLHDASTREIATKFEISEDSAESRRRRLIQKLKNKLAPARRKVASRGN